MVNHKGGTCKATTKNVVFIPAATDKIDLEKLILANTDSKEYNIYKK